MKINTRCGLCTKEGVMDSVWGSLWEGTSELGFEGGWNLLDEQVGGGEIPGARGIAL